jgi:uncharacterized protein YcbX
VEIVGLFRYPVKSMIGEALTEAELTAGGLTGDRRHAVVDATTGLVASAKHPRRWAALLQMSATRAARAPETVRLTLPDGSTVASDDPSVHRRLSDALGRAVRLSARREQAATIERLAPEVEPNPGLLTRNRLATAAPDGGFVDVAPVHLLTTAALSGLRAAAPASDADPRRFRPNLLVRVPDGSGFVENGWVDRTLRVGSTVRLRVFAPTPRCLVPTLAHAPDLGRAPELLRALARANRVSVLDLGRFACAGVYATVVAGGVIRLGDTIQPA